MWRADWRIWRRPADAGQRPEPGTLAGRRPSGDGQGAECTAGPSKEKEVADFLRSALPLVDAEAGTISWFAIQEGPSSFAIFDTFDDEAGRDAHLNGKVAAALMEKARGGDLFAKAPEIHKLGILADKLPKK
jgi:quinol monooxygenase YgiN